MIRAYLLPFVFLALVVLSCPAAYADELQDRLKTAVEAYRDTLVPEYADASLRRAMILVDDAVAQSNPSHVVKPGDIGTWLAANQPVDPVDPALRKSLVESLSGALTQVMVPNTVYSSALPPQELRVAELQLRLIAAVDDVIPGPSRAELAAHDKAAGEQLAKRIAEEHLARRVSAYKRLVGMR